ncbi:class I SAM-dependent methyltransferase [Clostridium sp.]|uniref:class I SAM-dependent methyltransferase n=1 Tax=Clostridium sp. TaxID=1506 RepID=UPI002FC79F87
MHRVKKFFDEMADTWDERSSTERIEEILEVINVKEDSRILDVCCGTGILESYLLKYNPKYILGVDISSKMIEIAKEKFDKENIEYLCEDIYEINSGEFELIIIFNAFPHLVYQRKILKNLSGLLANNGRLVICHNFSREKINNIHSKNSEAKRISIDLIKGEEVAYITKDYLDKELIIDNSNMYVVVLKNKKD